MEKVQNAFVNRKGPDRHRFCTVLSGSLLFTYPLVGPRKTIGNSKGSDWTAQMGTLLVAYTVLSELQIRQNFWG